MNYKAMTKMLELFNTKLITNQNAKNIMTKDEKKYLGWAINEVIEFVWIERDHK